MHRMQGRVGLSRALQPTTSADKPALAPLNLHNVKDISLSKSEGYGCDANERSRKDRRILRNYGLL